MPLYRRYQLLQKYIYELPFNPKTTKKSEEYTEHEYASESDCIKNIIRQWVDDGFECGLGLKYQKLKEQISTDFGKHWEDSGNWRIGEIIERQSKDCPTLKWEDTKIGDYLLKDKVTNAFVCASMEEMEGSTLGIDQFQIIGQVTVPPSHGRYGNDKVGSIAYKGVKGCILDNIDIGNNIDSLKCYNANAGFALSTVHDDDIEYLEIPVYNPKKTQYIYEYALDPDYKIYNNENPVNPVPSCGEPRYKCLILPYNSDGSINEDFDYPMDGIELSVEANAVINDGITGEYTLYVPSFGEMAYFFPNYTRLTYIRNSKLPENFGNFIMTINQYGWNPKWFFVFDTHCHFIFGTPSCDSTYLTQNVIYFVQFDGEKFITPNGVKRWVESDDTMCDGTTKCKTEYEEVFNEGVWSRTGQTRPGEVIETESIDCGFSYPRVALKNLSTGKIEFVDADELGSGQYTTDNYEKFGIEIDTLTYSDGTKAVLRLGTIDCTSVFSNCNGLTVIGSMYIKADTGIANTSVETALTLTNGFENTQLVLADGTVDWLNETWTCSKSTSSNGYNRHKYYPFWTAYKNDAYIPSVGEINAIFTKGLKYFRTSMEKLGNTFGSNGFLTNFCELNGSNVLNMVGTSSIGDYPLVCDWSDSSFINGDYDTGYNWIMFSRVKDDGTILIPTTYAD